MMSGLYFDSFPGKDSGIGSGCTHFWSQYMYLHKIFKFGSIQPFMFLVFSAKCMVITTTFCWLGE